MADEQIVKRGGRFKDLTGQRFPKDGYGVFVKRFVGINKNKKPLYEILCDCGTEKVIVGASLVGGLVISCGCVRDQKAKARRIESGTKCVNGRTGTCEERTWRSIKQRCNNPKSTTYYKYGGRGIRVCRGIINSFEMFLKAVGGLRPAGQTIDRKNNNGHYSCGECAECVENGWPSNIHWATTIEQARNKRTNRNLTLLGKTQCVAAWCEELGVPYSRFKWRTRSLGWAPEKALTTPVLR